jgi:hypothetical protein
MNLEAFEYFQKGKYFQRMSHELGGNQKAIVMFEKATELDSNFAMAHAALARSYIDVSGTLSPLAPEARGEYRDKAAWRLVKAERLSPEIAEVHLARGLYFARVKKDVQSAQSEYDAAYRLRPNDADVVAVVAEFALNSQHDYETSLVLSKKAIELDPLQGYGVSYAAWSLLLLRRYAEAEQYVNLYIRTWPADGLGYLQRVKVLLWGFGDPTKAMRAWDEGRKLATTNTDRLGRLWEMWEVPFYARDFKCVLALAETSKSNYRFMCRAFSYAVMGKIHEARVNLDSMHKALESGLSPGPDDRLIDSSLTLALVHAALGNSADALEYISKIEGNRENFGVWRVRDVILLYVYVGDVEKAMRTIEISLSRPGGITRAMMRLDPRFDTIRRDAEFQKLLIE